jgi:hypothetical protein
VFPDPIAPLVNHIEIKLRNGTCLGFLSRFLGPNARLRGYCPGDCLLEPIASPQPNVFWFVENRRQNICRFETLVFRNVPQHLMYLLK